MKPRKLANKTSNPYRRKKREVRNSSVYEQQQADSKSMCHIESFKLSNSPSTVLENSNSNLNDSSNIEKKYLVLSGNDSLESSSKIEACFEKKSASSNQLKNENLKPNKARKIQGLQNSTTETRTSDTRISDDSSSKGYFICAACNKQIKRDKYLLRACEKYWHENCLRCDRCRCRLGEVGSTLFAKSNMILCRTDYIEMFGQTGVCSLCYKLITASELVMKAKENVYHLDCFACQVCNQRFCIGDKFYLCNNKIVCHYDFEDQAEATRLQTFYDDCAQTECASLMSVKHCLTSNGTCGERIVVVSDIESSNNSSNRISAAVNELLLVSKTGKTEIGTNMDELFTAVGCGNNNNNENNNNNSNKNNDDDDDGDVDGDCRRTIETNYDSLNDLRNDNASIVKSVDSSNSPDLNSNSNNNNCINNNNNGGQQQQCTVNSIHIDSLQYQTIATATKAPSLVS